MPLGMGTPIDFEPPVLTIDPGPNPRYVTASTVITGSATDNVGVDRIVAIEQSENRVLGNAVIVGNRWSMTLNLTDNDNGKRLLVRFEAYDRAGNCGEESIQELTIVVDIRPPVFSNVQIRRSASRFTTLESLIFLQNLEHSDPNGYQFQNVERYQNGTFNIGASVLDSETSIDRTSIRLMIYDATPGRDVEGMEVFNKAHTSGSIFNPEWTITENELIRGGLAQSWNYESILAANGRLYFRVTVIAQDLAKNKTIRDDFGYFCLYRYADNPKIVPNTSIRYLDLGTTIPLDIFDDDALEFAYADLITWNQFWGSEHNGGDVNANQETRLNNIFNKIVAGTPVANFNGGFFTNLAINDPDTADANITIPNEALFYGDYYLIAFAKDKKSPPHKFGDAAEITETRSAPVWTRRIWEVTIADRNAPIIVIDTTPGTDDALPGASTGNSPEENTFPELYANGGGTKKYFNINGYILDDDGRSRGGVDLLRMAWIPYNENVPGYQENVLAQVRDALHENTTAANTAMDNLGVQYWTLSDSTNSAHSSYFVDGTNESISTTTFRKQSFRKQFDIMGGQDDLKSGYNNFHYNCSGCSGGISECLENDPKVFVLYARDIDGNITYRNIRLLGNRAPPRLNIYDLTILAAEEGVFTGVTDFSNQALHYDAIAGLNYDETHIMADPFHAYPRGTTLVFLIEGNEQGGLPVNNIRMHDRIKDEYTGHYSNGLMTYVTKLDGEDSQKMFEFEVINELNIKNYIQRTVAVTSSAQLNEIIAEQTSGTYPRGETINLKAHFTNSVVVLPGTGGARPVLHIRYQTMGGWVHVAVPYSGEFNDPSMYLDFDWDVPNGALGLLETYQTGVTWWQEDGRTIDRPISLISGSDIRDAASDNIRAFMPPEIQWTLANTLHYRKQIRMDGLSPTLEGIAITGKAINDDDKYYFKHGETITFTLTMEDNSFKTQNNQIRPDHETVSPPNPRLVFRIIEEGGSDLGRDFLANYLRPAGNRGMVFTFPLTSLSVEPSWFVNAARAGTIVVTGVNTDQGSITDPVGNELDITGISGKVSHTMHIDLRRPGTSEPQINGIPPIAVPLGTPPADGEINYYTKNPTLTMPPADGPGVEPFGVNMAYSMNGFEWVEFPNVREGWTTDNSGAVIINSGKWIFRTRQIDKAGNEGDQFIYNLEVNGEFPRITEIRSTSTDGFYIPTVVGPVSTPPTIRLFLDFAHKVKTIDTNNAYIIVADAKRDLAALNTALNAFGTLTALKNHIATLDDVDIIHPVAITDPNGSFFLEFEWRPVLKEMSDGITIAKIKLYGGVEDIYGNEGDDSTAALAYPGAVSMAHIDDKGASAPYTRTNLNGVGIKVFTIPPRLVASTPGNAYGNVTSPTAVLSGRRDTITLTFNSAMQKGMGTIIIRPRECDGINDAAGSCPYGTAHTVNCRNMIPIPPVFPMDNYYQEEQVMVGGDLVTIRYPVESFYDVYNKLDDAGKKTVLRDRLGLYSNEGQSESGSGTFDDPTLHARTALFVGPYILTTQGLVPGAGFTGEGTGTPVLVEDGKNSYYEIDDEEVDNPGWFKMGSASDPNPFMVPNITGKFVLDYQFAICETIWSYDASGNLVTGTVIHGGTNVAENVTLWNQAQPATPTANNPFKRDVVLRIRNALSRAKFRWQEMEVASSNISINNDGDRRTVTIKLEYPLPKGMRWDISWSQQALLNEAGVVAEVDPNWWFWTDGVQEPVIRVDRKSLDHREQVPKGNLNFFHDPPTTVGTVSLTGGGSSQNFDTLNYRYESETPGAVITVGEWRGDQRATNMSAQMAWDGTVNGITWPNAWNASHATFPVSNGTWIRPNILQRTITGRWLNAANDTTNRPQPAIIYYEKENDELVRRQGQGNLRLIRSYNRDIKRDELNNITLNASLTARSAGITGIPRLMASKNYVVAQAVAPHGGLITDVNSTNSNKKAAKGYEGIFKTIVALNWANGSNDNPTFNNNSNAWVKIGGSTNPDGSSSVPGFPLLMGSGDLRYVRTMALNTSNNQRVWISTEVVSPMYARFCSRKDGSSLLSQPWTLTGDVGPYVSGGYGELTYSYGQDRRN